MVRLLFILGTRPEAIKRAPLIRQFHKHEREFESRICISAQHRNMLHQVLKSFDVRADFDLSIMKPDKTLFEVTANALKGIERVLDDYVPDWVLVQGATATTFTGALAASSGLAEGGIVSREARV